MMEADYSAAYARLYREHWWWRVRETILVEKLRELLKGAPAARILDVGCGEGVFFEALEEYGCPEGIESDAARSGTIENEQTPSTASLISFQVVYFGVPAARADR